MMLMMMAKTQQIQPNVEMVVGRSESILDLRTPFLIYIYIYIHMYGIVYLYITYSLLL